MLDAKAAEVRHFCTDLLEPLAKSKKLQEGSLHEKVVRNVASVVQTCTSTWKLFTAASWLKVGKSL